MKGHLKLLKSLDNKLNAAYASAQKSFAGRVLLKLTSEVILACLLAFAVYVATKGNLARDKNKRGTVTPLFY